jgi:Mg2+-importing ATPase
MLTFGLLSSVFDYLTFGALLYLLRAGTEEFRTGWFVESVLSAALVVLVVRSRRPFFRSRPGQRLLLATVGVVAVTLALPFLPVAPLLGLTPLPLSFLALLALIVAMYIVSAELAKQLFYRHIEPSSARPPSSQQEPRMRGSITGLDP